MHVIKDTIKNKFEDHNLTDYQRYWFNVLDMMTNNLAGANIKACTSYKDGRTNSIEDEKTMINTLQAQSVANDFIKNNCRLDFPKEREWHDFAVTDRGNRYPPAYVNLKSSTLQSNDNLNCKQGIFFTLTGKPTMSYNEKSYNNNIGWPMFFEILGKNLNLESHMDYFFIILNKTNTSDIILTSLRSIETLIPNANNLPFQAAWNKCRNLVCSNDKTDELVYILDSFKKSLEKLNIPFSSYMEHIQPKLCYFKK